MSRQLFNATGRDVKKVEGDGGRMTPEKRISAMVTRKYLEEQLLLAQEENDRPKIEALQQKLRMLEDVESQDQMTQAMQEEEDFSKWLVGRGKEEDHIRTPWYRTPITNVVEGARQFIEVKMKARYDFLQKMAELRAKQVPSNLKEAFSYFKYIVKGMDQGELAFMEEWTSVKNHEKDVMRYGRKVADQLDGWWQKKGPIMPDSEIKLLETDFNAYMQLLFSMNPTDRQRLAKKLQLRAETLEKLATNQHHESIRDLLIKYQDDSMEYDEAILFNLGAYEKMMAEDKRLTNVSSMLAKSPLLRDNKALRSDIVRQLQSVRSRMDSLVDNMTGTMKKVQDDPTKIQKLKQVLADRAARKAVPSEIWNLVHGNGSMLSLRGGLVEQWDAMITEGRALVETAIRVRWRRADDPVLARVSDMFKFFIDEMTKMSDKDWNI